MANAKPTNSVKTTNVVKTKEAGPVKVINTKPVTKLNNGSKNTGK